MNGRKWGDWRRGWPDRWMGWNQPLLQKKLFSPQLLEKGNMGINFDENFDNIFKGKTKENIFAVGDYFPFLLLMFFLLIYGVCIRL